MNIFLSMKTSPPVCLIGLTITAAAVPPVAPGTCLAPCKGLCQRHLRSLQNNPTGRKRRSGRLKPLPKGAQAFLCLGTQGPSPSRYLKDTPHQPPACRAGLLPPCLPPSSTLTTRFSSLLGTRSSPGPAPLPTPSHTLPFPSPRSQRGARPVGSRHVWFF